jgi:hypothetical protein
MGKKNAGGLGRAIYKDRFAAKRGASPYEAVRIRFDNF